MASMEGHVDGYPDIPVCLVTSWYGHHAWANFAKFDAFRTRNNQPVKLVSGVWLHAFDYMQQSWAGEVEFGNDAALLLDDFRLRWFDHWLKGIDRGIGDDPPLTLFVMGGGDGRRNLAGRMRHGGYWRAESDWPLARTNFIPFYAHSDGSLRRDAPHEPQSATTFTFDPRDPVPTVGGNVQNPIGGEVGIMYGGAYDQRGRSDLILCSDTL